jgi:hypothetical protein
MRSRMLIVALLIATSLGLGPLARAEEDPLNLQVAGYERLAAGAKFSIEPTENTELSSDVMARLKEALTRHGFAYGKSSHLVMTVAADRVGGERPPAATFDQSTAQFHLSMGDNKPPLSAQIGRQYRISVDLYDRLSGRYLWRAQITDLKPDANPLAASKPMVEQLVKAMALWAGPGH